MAASNMDQLAISQSLQFCGPTSQKMGRIECSIKRHKGVSVDDILKEKCPRYRSPCQNPTSAGGEGSCDGVCARIPLDKRPMISKAYNSSDFVNVDSKPVILPMIDDDGIIRFQCETDTESSLNEEAETNIDTQKRLLFNCFKLAKIGRRK